MQDELFNPTIRARDTAGKPPWRPDSIFYPAFFGGPIAAATLGEDVIHRQRSIIDGNDAGSDVGESGMITGREILSPVDVHMVLRPQCTIVFRGSHEDKPFLEQQLGNDARPDRSGVNDRDVERAFLDLLHQALA